MFQALTDSAALESWFAEHADVSLPDGRYEFWGRHTPDGERGRQRLLDVEADRRLRFAWRVDDGEATVEIQLEHEDPAGTVLTLWSDPAPGNFWYLAVHDLANYAEGRDLMARPDYTRGWYGEVRLDVVVGVPPERVFAALVEPELIDRWIPGKAVVEPHVGGRYDFGWGHGPVEIVELEPDRLLAYSWEDPGRPRSVVRWRLSDRGGSTHLAFTHDGYGDEGGWREGILQLKRLSELGGDWRPIEHG